MTLVHTLTFTRYVTWNLRNLGQREFYRILLNFQLLDRGYISSFFIHLFIHPSKLRVLIKYTISMTKQLFLSFVVISQRPLMHLCVVDNTIVSIFFLSSLVITNMARLSGLFSIILAFLAFANASAKVVTHDVTFVSCMQGSTCPQGNPSFFSKTFALNNNLSPSLKLNVGDKLVFNLATDVSFHPLTICKNSPVPRFCQGATGSDILNTPLTRSGTRTSVTFVTAGTYYYGCLNHPGMGGTINVIQRTTVTSTQRRTTRRRTRRTTTLTTTPRTTRTG
jgi:plastocyanin